MNEAIKKFGDRASFLCKCDKTHWDALFERPQYKFADLKEYYEHMQFVRTSDGSKFFVELITRESRAAAKRAAPKRRSQFVIDERFLDTLLDAAATSRSPAEPAVAAGSGAAGCAPAAVVAESKRKRDVDGALPLVAVAAGSGAAGCAPAAVVAESKRKRDVDEASPPTPHSSAVVAHEGELQYIITKEMQQTLQGRLPFSFRVEASVETRLFPNTVHIPSRLFWKEDWRIAEVLYRMSMEDQESRDVVTFALLRGSEVLVRGVVLMARNNSLRFTGKGSIAEKYEFVKNCALYPERCLYQDPGVVNPAVETLFLEELKLERVRVPEVPDARQNAELYKKFMELARAAPLTSAAQIVIVEQLMKAWSTQPYLRHLWRQELVPTLVIYETPVKKWLLVSLPYELKKMRDVLKSYGSAGTPCAHPWKPKSRSQNFRLPWDALFQPSAWPLVTALLLCSEKATNSIDTAIKTDLQVVAILNAAHGLDLRSETEGDKAALEACFSGAVRFDTQSVCVESASGETEEVLFASSMKRPRLDPSASALASAPALASALQAPPESVFVSAPAPPPAAEPEPESVINSEKEEKEFEEKDFEALERAQMEELAEAEAALGLLLEIKHKA